MLRADSAAWVKSQSRMASTSNQETFRVDVPGRLVFDVLRQVSRLACSVLLMYLFAHTIF